MIFYGSLRSGGFTDELWLIFFVPDLSRPLPAEPKFYCLEFRLEDIAPLLEGMLMLPADILFEVIDVLLFG